MLLFWHRGAAVLLEVLVSYDGSRFSAPNASPGTPTPVLTRPPYSVRVYLDRRDTRMASKTLRGSA
jgi:hypothetical protein